ncbi:MAG: sigma-70 family RNA polymerase sigma factor [Candidatus Brocadiae bacterium]|nr:sigma-70 family RNA polymerase sigma factor [Candidatus Brocadiia bacterium]
MDDWDLVRASADGDRLAWERLQAKYERLLYYVVAHSSWLPYRDKSAEDAVQETWCVLYGKHKGGTLDTSKRFSRVLSRICENICARFGREARRSGHSVGHREDGSIIEQEATGASPDEEAARLEILCATSACLEELPEEDKQFYRLRYVEGRTLKEVAAALGCGVRNIHQRRIPRLGRKLRRCLNRRGYRNSEIDELFRSPSDDEAPDVSEGT